jgi:CHAT domain-containing protein
VLRFAAQSALVPNPPLVAADPDFDLQGVGENSFSPGTPFRRLEGTQQEGVATAEMLKVTPLLGVQALETRIKGMPSPRILHIASHGFFLPNVPKEPDRGHLGMVTRGTPEGDRLARLAQVENPLLRSGLALAGANTWLQEGSLAPEAEDGILTAEDVSGLDLLATDLVVLSACETGLGQVQVGEGVFGLRRAFVLAGAKTLVMSLWKVPDRETQELMVDFYQRILQGQPRAEALREAQLAIREKHPDPLYWGAFICQGYPGPLS